MKREDIKPPDRPAKAAPTTKATTATRRTFIPLMRATTAFSDMALRDKPTQVQRSISKRAATVTAAIATMAIRSLVRKIGPILIAPEGSPLFAIIGSEPTTSSTTFWSKIESPNEAMMTLFGSRLLIGRKMSRSTSHPNTAMNTMTRVSEARGPRLRY